MYGSRYFPNPNPSFTIDDINEEVEDEDEDNDETVCSCCGNTWQWYFVSNGAHYCPDCCK